MRLDTTQVIAVWCAVIITVVFGALAYRERLDANAHWITKTLCDGKPVITGKYGRCLQHYAPATAGVNASG
jgi:hypothetical protein